MNASLQLSPLLPYALLAVVAGFAAVVALAARWKHAPDFYARALFFALLALLLLDPFLVRETRKPLPDKLVIVDDDSPSEKIANRDKTARKILAHIKDELKSMPDVQPVVIHAGRDPASLHNQDTELFSVLRDSLSGLPLSRIAGTVFITDGEVHDVPQDIGPWEKLAPFSVVLTGKKGEFDRRVTIVSAPEYGLLSKSVTIRVRVDDAGRGPAGPVTLDVAQDGKPAGTRTIMPGVTQSFTFRLGHSGQNVFEFSVPPEKGELTALNNTADVIVNGVRDRLKVLLVSGRPHIGERAWRDLLKSDPSIDLVHFTILRSPDSFDPTPPGQMSLIAFPVGELFDKKINAFDLIVFDDYAQYGLLLPQYFANLAKYVQNGGAFLMELGGDRREVSLFRSPLAPILPVAPEEPYGLLQGAYAPQLTQDGERHPVTAGLQEDAGAAPWGRWLTQADVSKTRGDTLMTGLHGDPLLVLDQAGKGRVAVLTSDNAWMWAKGIDGGGPYVGLLRRVAHWLMKEPSLEPDYIRAEVHGGTITVSERDLAPPPLPVTLTRPDGKTENISLAAAGKNGWVSATVTADGNGVYRFGNGKKSAFAIVGTGVSREFSDVHTTEQKLAPLVDKTRGAMIWYGEEPRFSLKRVAASAGSFGGSDWIGVRKNGVYAVGSISGAALFPNGLLLALVLGGLLGVWACESGFPSKRV
ncbi:MAG: hypothetical protein KGQ70_06780 [Alphaproteobacteria bacterium]|nr:hypothetical protein [Alphaproteobacteria bacterium]